MILKGIPLKENQQVYSISLHDIEEGGIFLSPEGAQMAQKVWASIDSRY